MSQGKWKTHNEDAADRDSRKHFRSAFRSQSHKFAVRQRIHTSIAHHWPLVAKTVLNALPDILQEQRSCACKLSIKTELTRSKLQVHTLPWPLIACYTFPTTQGTELRWCTRINMNVKLNDMMTQTLCTAYSELPLSGTAALQYLVPGRTSMIYLYSINNKTAASVFSTETSDSIVLPPCQQPGSAPLSIRGSTHVSHMTPCHACWLTRLHRGQMLSIY